MIDASDYFLTPEQIALGWRVYESLADNLLLLHRYGTAMEVGCFGALADQPEIQNLIRRLTGN